MSTVHQVKQHFHNVEGINIQPDLVAFLMKYTNEKREVLMHSREQ